MKSVLSCPPDHLFALLPLTLYWEKAALGVGQSSHPALNEIRGSRCEGDGRWGGEGLFDVHTLTFSLLHTSYFIHNSHHFIQKLCVGMTHNGALGNWQ